MALAKLAVRRQATIGEAELNIFSDDLIRFELVDVVRALDIIGSTPRGERELAFPDSGTLSRAVQSSEESRKMRIRPEQLRPEVREALAAESERTRRLAAGEPFERVDIDKMILEGSMPRAMLPAKVEEPAEPVESICPHCNLATQLSASPVELRRMAAYYLQKAERAEDRIAAKKDAQS